MRPAPSPGAAIWTMWQHADPHGQSTQPNAQLFAGLAKRCLQQRRLEDRGPICQTPARCVQEVGETARPPENTADRPASSFGPVHGRGAWHRGCSVTTRSLPAVRLHRALLAESDRQYTLARVPNQEIPGIASRQLDNPGEPDNPGFPRRPPSRGRQVPGCWWGEAVRAGGYVRHVCP